MIEKILIANRGEIAVRIIKTARKLGIKTVALYSEADTNSLAVQMADEAYYIGSSPANMSYLNIEKIIDVIEQSGADAVHPGYGFLSENYNFAKELEKLSIKFIGPGRGAIRDMGDKIISKKIAQEVGVNTVPGYLGEIETVARAEEIAEEIGFPVMIKAAAGGGGRGMRIVYEKKEIEKAYNSAILEAKNSFGDGRIFIEKFIEQPRHIEIQILADQHGNVVCLGERECSIQRYNQKIIEEAPSVFLTEEIRNEMYRQSKELALRVGYYSAGTVEYIVDAKRNFYFLEMNTRLQVEHPVTELITGLDLVEEMIKVADGKKLSITQKDIKLKGWAMESRIYAEDPTRGFLPSSGRIGKYQEPEKNKNVRVDTGVYEGGEVSMFYDPMIAKLCSYGNNRKSAIKHMRSALSEFVIEGVSNNIGFLEDIYKSKRFSEGKLTTNYINDEYPGGFKLQDIAEVEHSNIIYAASIIKWLEVQRVAAISGKLPGREREINTRWAVCIKDDINIVEIIQVSESEFVLEVRGEKVSVNINWLPGSPLFKANIDGNDIAIRFVKMKHKSSYKFFYLGGQLEVSVVSPRAAELMKYMPKASNDIDITALKAPISGKIMDVKVNKGEKIKAGTELIIIEAMKMENSIVADHDVEIESINIAAGDNVQSGDTIIKFASK